MLRGLTHKENCIALAVEAALPYSTSQLSGWREVTEERKQICRMASRAAVISLAAHGYKIIKAKQKD